MMRAMIRFSQRGQVNPTVALLIVGLVIAGVWVWKRLAPEIQDVIVEQAVPLAALATAVSFVIWRVVRWMLRRRRVRQARALLLARFQQETAPGKRFDLACELVELNEYRSEGLEAVEKDLFAIFS
jgi:hypothetical protein